MKVGQLCPKLNVSYVLIEQIVRSMAVQAHRSIALHACLPMHCDMSAPSYYTVTQRLCAFREGGSIKKPRRRKQAQPESESEESEDEESDGDFGMEPLPSPKGSAPPGSPAVVSPGKDEPPHVVCCLCLCGLLSMPYLRTLASLLVYRLRALSLALLCLFGVWHVPLPLHCTHYTAAQ